jgi:hypothetical protein
MLWSSGDYPFAQEYSAYMWIEDTISCDGEQTVFRVVIDTPDEGSNGGANPNF